MIQIISYDIKKTMITVGFKVDSFIVYSVIKNDESKTKQQLLQLAYQQVKNTIEYEKTLNEHSFITDEIGEEFIPEEPRIDRIFLSIDKDYIQFEVDEISRDVLITTKVLDQYGDMLDISPTITFTLGDILENILTIPKVEVITEVVITATIDDLEVLKTINISPYVEKTDYIQESLNNALDRVSIIDSYNVEISNTLEVLKLENIRLKSLSEELMANNYDLRASALNLEEDSMNLMLASADAYETMYTEDTQLMLAIAEVYETLFINGLII